MTITSRIKYIFSFFIILSLFGFGENSFINFPSVKNIKETEWVTRSIPNIKVSKCYNYNQISHIATTNLTLQPWSDEFRIIYDQKVNIKFLSQAKTCDKINTINLITNNIFIPRNSIEYHNISNKRTELPLRHGLSCAINRDDRNIKWNYLLNRKWINRRIYSLDISMELNALPNGSFVCYL